MRLHVIGLPHTQVSCDYSWCAYTIKTMRFARMMTTLGWEVVLYAAGNHAEIPDGIEFVPVGCRYVPPAHECFVPVFDATNDWFGPFNSDAVRELETRVDARDVICLIAGAANQPIADAFLAHQIVEYGIGYGGVIPTTHHVFESYAWMHTVTGAQTHGDSHAADGRFYDAVIPNYFDPDDFPLGHQDGGYLLYVGRLIERKGVQIAIDTAQATGLPLIVAGSGDYPLPDWVDYRGVVGPEERAQLMGAAVALLAPTLYVEPFGGVAVEAQMCGTPAITTDWGAFPETVKHGTTGFRCRTLREFVDSVDIAPTLDACQIRSRAIMRYSTTTVADQYARYLQRISDLWGDGFYTGVLSSQDVPSAA